MEQLVLGIFQEHLAKVREEESTNRSAGMEKCYGSIMHILTSVLLFFPSIGASI